MKRILFGLLLVLSYVSASFGQVTGEVGGKILDGELYNEPLLMAHVSIKNTDWSTQTNFNGNFEITGVTPGSYVLEIQFLGYESEKLPIEVKADEKIEIFESLKAKSLPLIMVSESTDEEIVGIAPFYPNNIKLDK